jgi:FtsP/CotA-like multicopper oxidase with cupredoxin domain
MMMPTHAALMAIGTIGVATRMVTRGEKTAVLCLELHRLIAANVGLGQRYDVIWTARHPGKWLIHCHLGHHTMNNNVEMQGGGLMMVIEVASG